MPGAAADWRLPCARFLVRRKARELASEYGWKICAENQSYQIWKSALDIFFVFLLPVPLKERERDLIIYLQFFSSGVLSALSVWVCKPL